MTSAYIASIVLALAPAAALQVGGGPVACADLLVTLVDAHGVSLGEGWSVNLGRWTDGAVTWEQRVRVDGGTGSVTLVGLTGDEVLIEGVHKTGERTARAVVRLAEGNEVELALDGPRPEESLFFALLGDRTPGGESLLPARVVAIDGAGREHDLVPEGARGSYVARGIGRGRYRIEVRDARFAPLLLEDAETGSLHCASLRGSATLALRFIDPVDHRPVVAANGLMWVTLAGGERFAYKGPTGPWWLPAPIDGVHAGEPPKTPRTPIGPDGVHHIESLLPGSAVRVLAMFDGHLEVELEEPAFAAGEVRSLDVALTRGLEVLGRVVDGHGAPIAGAFVLPLAPGATDAEALRDEDERLNSPRRPIVFPNPLSSHEAEQSEQLILRDIRSRATHSGADGTFRIGGLPLDTGHVLVSTTPWDIVRLDVTTEPTTPGAFPRGIAELVVTQRGAVDVQLRQTGPRNLKAYPHHFEFAVQIGGGPWRSSSEALRSLLDNDWCMRLRGLPLEPCRLRVTPRLADGAAATSAGGRTFEFTPALDTPTQVDVDLSPLAPR